MQLPEKLTKPSDGWDKEPRPVPEALRPKPVIPPGRKAIPLGHIAMVGDFQQKDM